MKKYFPNATLKTPNTANPASDMSTGFSDPGDDFVDFLIEEWEHSEDMKYGEGSVKQAMYDWWRDMDYRYPYRRRAAHKRLSTFGEALNRFYNETTLQEWDDKDHLE